MKNKYSIVFRIILGALLGLMFITMLSYVRKHNPIQLHQDTQPVNQGYVNSILEGKLHYKTYGYGSRILFLHDGPGLSQSYLMPQMADILSQSNRTTFIDQRGSGQSYYKKIKDKAINMDIFVRDVEAVRRHLGYNKFVLIGHSWGALLAMQYACIAQEYLTAMILINPMPITSKGYKAFMDEHNKRILPIRTDLLEISTSESFLKGEHHTINQYYHKLFSKYCANPQDANKLSFDFLQKNGLDGFKVDNIFSKTFFAHEYDFREELKKIQIPVLIIHSDYDPIPMWTAAEIKDAIPNSHLKIINDCGHFPHIEKTIELESIINEFLEEIKGLPQIKDYK